MEKYIEIGGRLHSTATGNVTTGANEILDDELNKKQSQINSETLQHVESIDAALQELSPDQTQALALATDVNTLKAKSVRGDETQSLTDVEKEQAISNMGVTGVYDISGEHPVSGHPKKYSTLPAALADVPVGRRKSGMSVKALMQLTQEMYHVEVTEGVTDLPTGYNEYELSEASPMTTGDYTYSELDTENFGAIPSTVGASVLYYIYDSQSSSYTTWLLTKSSDSTYAYKQYLYMQEYANTTAGNTAFLTAANWQGVDDEPTAGSDNLVKSGGVWKELALGAVYDVSAKNPTAGPNNDGKFESLSALLSDANLNTLIPTAVRKGGMSIKFVQSSDNKYVQYRLMSNEWSIVLSDWVEEDTANVINSEKCDEDLTVADKDGNIAMQLYDGHIKTKNFDSKDAALKDVTPEIEESGHNADFMLADENGKCLLELSGGGIKTKNFDSGNTPIKDDTPEISVGSSGTDLDIADENDEVLVRFNNGHVKTKNFDSSEALTNNDDSVARVGSDTTHKDLSVEDEAGNDILAVAGGHIKTKNFDSANIDLSALRKEIYAKYDSYILYQNGGNTNVTGIPSDVDEMIDTTLQYIFHHSPYADVMLISNYIQSQGTFAPHIDWVGQRISYRGEMKAYCDFYGMSLIDLIPLGLMRPTVEFDEVDTGNDGSGIYTTDGIHAYNEAGAQRVFDATYGELLRKYGDSLASKKILILGSSSNVLTPQVAYQAITWVQKLVAKLGANNVKTYAVGGTGWLYTSGGTPNTNTVKQQYENAMSKLVDDHIISQGDNEIFNYDIIMIGTNNEAQRFRLDYPSTMRYLINKYN